MLSTLGAMDTTIFRALAVLALAALPVTFAAAEGLRPAGYFVQAGAGDDHVQSVTAGLAWPWSWRSDTLGAETSGLTEASIGHLSARFGEGRRGFTQIALVPIVRLRFAAGRSPWFAEGGIGISMTDQRFVTERKQFASTFNFVDVIGVGRSFGPRRDQELSVRLQHVSNAGLRRPNPGQDSLQLRYAASF